jgi:hypothetical protein
MLLSAVSVLVVVQQSSEVPEGLMDYLVYKELNNYVCFGILIYVPLKRKANTYFSQF